jgi:hypothetical protein
LLQKNILNHFRLTIPVIAILQKKINSLQREKVAYPDLENKSKTPSTLN